MATKAVRSGAQDYLVKDHADKSSLPRAIRYAVERGRVEEQLRHLSGRLLHLQDEERRRIARALHDSTAQTLAALSMRLALLEKQSGALPPDARTLLDECRACTEQCVSEVRTTSYLLHPPLLDELGLTGAIREYADGFAERSRIRVDLELPPCYTRLPVDQETAIFRVMQEALANIHRHSGSVTASVALTQTGSEIRLSVRDAGKGIPSDKLSSGNTAAGLGVGIAGMRERMRQLGGHLHIASDRSGTTVAAVLPLTPAV